jgi:chromate reductase
MHIYSVNPPKIPIAIVIGTNRPNSISGAIARYYQQLLTSLDTPSIILDLEELPHDFTVSALYGNSGKNQDFNKFNERIKATEKFVFIVPEYNGSYPGVLKAFIDGLPYPNSFADKKAALVGISSNLHGASAALSHLNDVFSYLGMHTLALRVKLSRIQANFSGNDFSSDLYKELLDMQAHQLLSF